MAIAILIPFHIMRYTQPYNYPNFTEHLANACMMVVIMGGTCAGVFWAKATPFYVDKLSGFLEKECNLNARPIAREKIFTGVFMVAVAVLLLLAVG